MSPWRVILATLVIFTSGLLTGGVAGRYLAAPREGRVSPSPEDLPFRPQMLREEFVRQMQRELDLSPGQKEKISRTVHKAQERIRICYDSIAPDVRDELRRTREEMRSELTPEQAKQFEEFLRKRKARAAEMPPFDRRRQPPSPGSGPRSQTSSNHNPRLPSDLEH